MKTPRTIIRALTLREEILKPWATLILHGIKKIETRTWTTKYRGDILITSSKSSKSKYAGKAICIAELYDIKPMTKEHELWAQCEVYPRAQSWFLRNIIPIDPFDIKGGLGLFNVDVTNKIKFI